MIASGSPLLGDPARFAQAVGVLKREELSPRDERWFRWLNRLTWSALLLSVACAVVLRTLPPVQIYVLVMASVCYLAVLPAFCMNVPLFIKVFVASRRERALFLTKPLTRIALREPGARVRNVLNSVLVIIGLVALYWGVVGISVWRNANDIGRLWAVSLLGLGLSCLLIYPVERARRRLLALSTLRQALDRAKDGSIEVLYYDAIFVVEHRQIIEDREQAIGNAAGESSTTVRLSDPFLLAASALPVDQSAAVYATIQELSAAAEAADGIRVRRVDDLRLAVRYERDHENDEMTILALVRLEEPSDEGERD
jgi:hypothetical protein